jgi:thymidylate synthase (FAD)
MHIETVPTPIHENLEKSVDPLKDGISSLELIRVSGSDIDIANAARVSYGKFVTHITERDEKLITFLLEHNHTSPFEHNQLSFRVKAPIFVTRQWMRHRMNSYNEISYRYVKAPLEFYIPPYWRYQDTVNKQASVGSFINDSFLEQYKHSLATSVKTYESLLEQGVCRELARGLLPLCTYTQFIFTCNLHSLMHFCKLRLHAGAQFEIRMFAHHILALALPHFPVSLSQWKKIHAAELNLEGFDTFTAAFTKALEEKKG